MHFGGAATPPNLPTAGAGAWPGGARGGAASRVSCAGRALETLTPCGGRGRAAPVARAVSAGTRLPRREWRVWRGLCRAVRGRVVRRYAPPRAASRVSCAGRALETLTPGGGAGPHPWRERWARGRAYRGGKWRARRGFCAAGALPGGARARGPAVCAAACGESRFLRRKGARNAFLLAALAGGGREAEKKGGRAGGRGPLYACRGTKKIFSVKEILFINERNFFRGAGRTKKARLPGGGGGRREAGGSEGEFFADIGRQVVHLDADLGHGVAVAHGDGAVLDGVEIDRHAQGRADLVLAAVALADGAGFVIVHHEVSGELFVDLGGQAAELVFCRGSTAHL